MKPAKQTPVEKTAEMLRQGLELPTIALCLNIAPSTAERLVGAAKRYNKMKQDDTARLQYRVSVLPGQLENARRKVAMLEREALRIGLRDLVRPDQHP